MRPNWPKQSPTTNSCHQNISSPTSVTNINVTNKVYWRSMNLVTKTNFFGQYYITNIGLFPCGHFIRSSCDRPPASWQYNSIKSAVVNLYILLEFVMRQQQTFSNHVAYSHALFMTYLFSSFSYSQSSEDQLVSNPFETTSLFLVCLSFKY